MTLLSKLIWAGVLALLDPSLLGETFDLQAHLVKGGNQI